MNAKTLGARALAIFLFLSLLAVGLQQPSLANHHETSNLAPEAPSLAPSLWATPLKLNFAPVGVGKVSNIQVVTVKNTGNALLANFSNTGLSGPFQSSNTCASGVQPGNTCTYSFWMEPAVAGAYETSITITTNAGSFSVELLGEGVAPQISVSPLSLDFGTVLASPENLDIKLAEQQIVSVRNTGLSEVAGFSGGSVPEPFQMTNDCPPSLAPGDTCQIFYNFFPTTDGTFTTTSTINTNAGSLVVKLMGKGESEPNQVSGLRVTPREIDFGPVGLGNDSAPQDIIITNLYTATFITDFAISNVSPAFTYTHTCNQNLAPGNSCVYSFRFVPSQAGEVSSTPLISNNLGSFPVTLHGTGVAADMSITPLSLDFGVVPTGTTSAPQYVTIKNTGLTELNDIYPSGVTPPFSGSQNCSDGLLPGETCQLTFYFSPIEYGRYISPTITTGGGKAVQIILQGGMELPQVKKSFLPDAIALGNYSTLEISIDNPNPSATLFDVQLSDNFPAGLVIASPLTYSLSPECGTPKFTPIAGQSYFNISEGTILGHQSCRIRVNVTAPIVGKYSNTTSPAITRYGAGAPASDELIVVDAFRSYLPYIHK